jgi:hypothetical protein
MEAFLAEREGWIETLAERLRRADIRGQELYVRREISAKLI